MVDGGWWMVVVLDGGGVGWWWVVDGGGVGWWWVVDGGGCWMVLDGGGWWWVVDGGVGWWWVVDRAPLVSGPDHHPPPSSTITIIHHQQTTIHFISFKIFYTRNKTLQQLIYKPYNLKSKKINFLKSLSPKCLICCCSRESFFKMSLAL